VKNIIHPQELPNQFQQPLSSANQTALPPQSAQNYASPANLWKAPNTDRLIQPRSVTEGTTKLLEKDK
jgi:hypothetical protein